MAERAGTPLPDLSAIGTNQRIAAETLSPELMHLAAGPMAEALAKAVSYAKRALSPRTEKIYADSWSAFEAWCRAHDAPSLSAVPAIVAAYLAHRAATVGRSGLNQIVSAIAHRHRKSGHAWSPQDPVIATVKSGILRSKKQPIRPASTLGSPEIRRLLVACNGIDGVDAPGGINAAENVQPYFSRSQNAMKVRRAGHWMLPPTKRLDGSLRSQANSNTGYRPECASLPYMCA